MPDTVSITLGMPELALPLVCDSPHSGTHYPVDFRHAVDRQALRFGEDTHVEALWSQVPAVGGTLIAANFPRTYIDANRDIDAIDPQMLDADWPHPMRSTPQVQLGIGLLWRQVAKGMPIYDRPLSVAEVQHRIDTCWRPYHEALRSAADQACERWGGYWHLNLHSMPHNAYERLGIQSPHPLADFVLGDLYGTSCDPEFVDVVKRAIETHGYRVAVNDPYEGAELVRKMGQPKAGRHSLQIEINRPLYMDERSRERNAHFENLRLDLVSVTQEIARYIRGRLNQLQAAA